MVILCFEVRESHSLYVSIYIFYVVISKDFFFAHGPFKYEYFSNISIWSLDQTLPDTITPSQSNSNEGVLKSSELEPHHQMYFSVICRIFGWNQTKNSEALIHE